MNKSKKLGLAALNVKPNSEINGKVQGGGALPQEGHAGIGAVAERKALVTTTREAADSVR